MFRPANWQQRLEITLEMIEAVSGDSGAVLGLGENERALEDGLRIKGGAVRRPCGVRRIARLGLGNISFEALGVLGRR